jgi:diguanylate cyclase (GGDEF)-like protein
MTSIKKNIWLAFKAITLIWILILILAVTVTYKDVYRQHIVEAENITSISSNSLKAVLKQYEVVFEILAKQLMQERMYLEKEPARALMGMVAQLDPSIISFAIFKPNGKLHLASTDIKLEGQSLLDLEEAKDSFLQTLESPYMVIGRTYIVPEIGQEPIIPLRKAVRNENGDVEFVLSFAIDPDKGFDFFIKNNSVDLDYRTYLYRDRDRYFQLTSPFMRPIEIDIVNYQVSEEAINLALDTLTKQTGLSLETIKRDQLIVSNINNSSGVERLFSSTYLNRYGLWISSDIPTIDIHKKIAFECFFWFLIFSSSLLVIYKLFQSIHSISINKEKELIFQSSHDYITNLYNRFYLEQHCDLDNKEEFWLLLIDMDNFNAINSSHGNESGDDALIMISKRLKKLIKNDDLLIRYGGNEFIIITKRKTIDEVKNFSKEILVNLRQPYPFEWGDFIMTASIGASHYPSDGNNLDEIRSCAGLAMHESKKLRNTTTYFQEKIKHRELYNSALEQELKYGLERNEFYMLYQPKVNAYGNPKGVEALVRWSNQTLGQISPDKFISIAENTGEMIALGDFIVDKALKDIADFNRSQTTILALSVNISVKQFIHPDFIKKLTHSLETNGFEASNLIIEITETLFIEDINSINETLTHLKSLGIKISLDDFGTGYSSLNLLTKLPIDELKIDKSFVDDIKIDSNAKSMAEGIIAIGKRLNLTIVAEGVETLDQLNVLNNMGCDIFQGYYFAKPLNTKELEDFCIINKTASY